MADEETLQPKPYSHLKTYKQSGNIMLVNYCIDSVCLHGFTIPFAKSKDILIFLDFAAQQWDTYFIFTKLMCFPLFGFAWFVPLQSRLPKTELNLD